jgi:hypothetical protein
LPPDNPAKPVESNGADSRSKIDKQIDKLGLPRSGTHPFRPKIRINRRGDQEIEKAEVEHGPKKGKRGFLDDMGRIWIRDRAHSGLPDHWDVQIDGGKRYIRVNDEGNEI